MSDNPTLVLEIDASAMKAGAKQAEQSLAQLAAKAQKTQQTIKDSSGSFRELANTVQGTVQSSLGGASVSFNSAEGAASALRREITLLGSKAASLSSIGISANGIAPAMANAAKQTLNATKEVDKLTAAQKRLNTANAPARIGGRLQNLSFQANDIGVSLASGQSLGLVAIQQGSQILQIYGLEGGVRGVFKGLAEDLVRLGSSIKVPLAALALIGGAVTGFQSQINAASATQVGFFDTLKATATVTARVVAGELKRSFGDVVGFVGGAINLVARGIGQIFINTIKIVATAIATIGSLLRELGRSAVDNVQSNVVSGLKALPDSIAGGLASRAESNLAILRKQREFDVFGQIAKDAERIANIDIFAQIKDESVKNALSSAEESTKKIGDAAVKAKSNVDELRKGIAGILTASESAFYTVGLDEYQAAVAGIDEQVQALTLQYGKLDEAERKSIELSKDLAQKTVGYKRLNDIITETRTPAEKLRIELESLEKDKGFARNAEDLDAVSRKYAQLVDTVDGSAQIFKDVATDISTKFTDVFEKIFSGGETSFKSLASSIGDIFKRLLARLAVLAIAQPVIVPVIQAAGSAFGLGGGTIDAVTSQLGFSGSASSGGGSFLSSINSASSAFSAVTKGLNASVFTAGGTIANTIDDIGFSLGLSAGKGGTLFGSGISANFTPASGIAGIGGNLLGNSVFGGKGYSSVGGTVGGIAGAAVGGPIGALVGSFLGNGLGSLFGGKAPKPASNFGADGFASDGALLGGKTYTKNASDEFAKSLLDAVGKSTQSLAGQTGLNFTNLKAVEGGSDDGRGFLSTGGNFKAFDLSRSVAFDPNDAKSTEEGLSRFLIQIVQKAQNASDVFRADLIPSLQGIVTQGRAVDDVLKDISFIANFKALGEEFVVNTTRVTAFEANVKALRDQFATASETATRLNLPLGELDKRLKEIEGTIRTSFNKSLDDAIIATGGGALGGIISEVQRYQDNLREAQLIGGDTAKVELLHKATMAQLIANNNDAEIGALQQRSQEASGLAAAYQRVGEALQASIDGIRVGQFSTLSPAQQLAEVQSRFNATAASARSGNIDAANSLPQLANELLGLGQSFFASGESFASLQKDTLQQLESARSSAASQVDIQSRIFQSNERQIQVLQAGFDGVQRSINDLAIEQLAALRGGTVSGGNVTSERGTFGTGNFNERVVALFGNGLASAPANVASQIESIFSQTANGVAAGGGRRSSFFAGNQQANEAAIALARQFGIAGFANGGTFSGTGLVGERGAEFITTSSSARVIPYQANTAVVESMQKANDNMQVMVRVTQAGFQQTIAKLQEVVDATLESGREKRVSGKRKGA